MTHFQEDTYQEDVFRDIDIDGGEVRGITFGQCTFEKCSFREVVFKFCKFKDCTFVNCDLSLMRVDQSAFAGIHFEDCKLAGVDWTQAAWGNKDALILKKGMGFTRCVLNYATFIGLALEKFTLKDCTAQEVDFSEAKLVGADFRGTDLAKSQFRHTDLTGADFRGARNYTIPPDMNTINNSKFSMPEAMSLLYSMDIVIDES